MVTVTVDQWIIDYNNKGVNVSDHLSPVIFEQLPPVLFNWNSIAAVTWETAGDLQIYFQNHFGSWTLHKLKFDILQVEHVAVTLLPLLFLLLLPGQVLEKCPARKAASQSSSPPTKIASPCITLKEAAWCRLDKSGSAEDTQGLPGVGTKSARHGCVGDPGCEIIQWGKDWNSDWADCGLNVKCSRQIMNRLVAVVPQSKNGCQQLVSSTLLLQRTLEAPRATLWTTP